MKLKFLESLMDKKVDLEPIYKAGFKPIKLREKITEADLKKILKVNSYVAWYDDETYKFENIYRIQYYENKNGIETVFCQPYNSFFNGWWLPTRGLEDNVNNGTIIPVIKKDQKDFSDYSGDDTEIDD